MLTIKLLKAFPQVFVKGNRKRLDFCRAHIWEQTDGSFFTKWQFLMGIRLSHHLQVLFALCNARHWKEASSGNCQNKENTWVIQQYKYMEMRCLHAVSSLLCLFSCAIAPGSFVLCSAFFWQGWRPFSSFVFKVKSSKHKANVRPDDLPPKLITLCPDWAGLRLEWW